MGEWEHVHDFIPYRMLDINSLVYVGEFSNEEDARDAIRRKRVTGMSYAKISEHKSAKSRKTDRLLAQEKIKLNGFLVESSVYKSHSGKTVGCRNCGSSFPRDYFVKNRKYRYNDFILADCTKSGCHIYVNNCSVCGHNMRSETAQKRVSG